MKLHFLRHGPTHAKTMIGWTDIAADLSDADQLAQINAALPKNAIGVSSDLKRASATLNAVIGERRVLPAAPGLREMHFGDWEDRSFADINATEPELIRNFWTDPGDAAPPNGESWNAFSARTSDAVDRVTTGVEADDMLITCHYGVILTQLARFGKIPAKSVLSFKIDPLSLTTIELLYDGQAQILGVNHNL